MAKTLGENLGGKVGEAIADANNIENQDKVSVTEKGPDGDVTIELPANPMRDNLIKDWELIGKKLIEFLAIMDKGSSDGFTLKLSSGEEITIKPNEALIKMGSASVTVSPSSIEMKIGSSSVKATSSGVDITGPIINLN